MVLAELLAAVETTDDLVTAKTLALYATGLLCSLIGRFPEAK